MVKNELNELRELFLKYLTRDSETQDGRRKDYNQAIFNRQEGWAIFTSIDLDMVMEKFDKALARFSKEGGKNK